MRHGRARHRLRAYTGPLFRIDLRGRGGLSIRDKWRAGPTNYLGIAVAGFPNFFYVAGPGSPSALTNFFVAVEHHTDWIAECIAWMAARGHATIEAVEDAETRWLEHVDAVAQRTIYFGCNSWYLGANIPGKPRIFVPLASGFPAYAERFAEVAARGYEGFALA